MKKLKALQKKHSILVDVRGKGLLIGLEYPTPEMGWAVSKGLFKRGVVTGGTLNNARVNRIEPPGIISYEIRVEDLTAGTTETFTTPLTSGTYNGTSGHTYLFASSATDLVGNVKGATSVAVASSLP